MIKDAVRIVEAHYELGELLHSEELHGGYVNRSFVIRAKRNDGQLKYLIRRYNPAINENEIRFEHALINYLKANGFDLAAGIIPSKTGATYVKQERAIEGRTHTEFWAVFEFLEGEDRYTWVDTKIAPEDMISAAKVLADLHQAGLNFSKPAGAERNQPKINDFLPTFRHTYRTYTSKAGKTRFDQYFLQHRDQILSAVEQALIPEQSRNSMPQIPVHCDFHQGNLKYDGSRVIGVFDFDWSKIDLRLFDIALALVYFCACWDGATAGSLKLDKFELFLSTYNHRCASKAGPGSLTLLERTFLPSMLAAANLFVLHWTIVDFYSIENPDEDEYLVFLNHGLKLMQWIEAQKDQIVGLIDQICL
ncbi:MAG: phosphotransferase [Desulfobacterales bacterium]|jgi:homoserine kinase type II